MTREDLKTSAWFMIALIIALLMCFAGLFSSCRSPQYIPVEKIKTEYRYIDRVQHDSIYQRDSINMWRDGDTVYLNKYRYLYKYLYINKVDSFTKTDSIQVPYPVERKLTKWEATKMELGGWAFGVLIVITLVIVGWLVYRWRNKKLTQVQK